MKSKYKLKIKEISMRLKNGSVLLLSIFCLFALASAVQAVPWTDPTCAAPDCNTDGPIWVNPEDPQDSSATSSDPMIYIIDSRTSGPTATAYVRSFLDNSAAIYGSSMGTTSTSYGGYFDATDAPGLKVMDGIVISSLADDPTYNEAGLLYLNSGTYANQFRYYSGGWRTLNPWINSGNELYYSLAAGNARGVAIKSGDLTGPNDAYTLDVYRKTSTDADPAYYAERALYARLASYGSDANYASGFIGGYDDYGNLVGVRGKVETSSTDPHYGGYFEATGPTGYGVQGIASNSGSTMNVGGTFSALGTNGVGVSGGAPAYGGYFQATGATGIGVAANGPSTPTETAYAIRTNDGAIAMGEIATIPDEQTNYGMIYVKQDGLDNKIYFKSEGNVEYDLTAGAGASGNIADGTVTGQMTYWNDSELPNGEWQPVASTDMLWDNTNKNLGIGVSPTAANKLHVVKSASSGDPVAVYASATRTVEISGGTVIGVRGIASAAVGDPAIGGYFSAGSNAGNYGVQGEGYVGGYFSTARGMGVYGESTDTTYGYGGYFVSNANDFAGVFGEGVTIGVQGHGVSGDGTTAYGGYFETSCPGQDCAGVYGESPAVGTSGNSGGVVGVATANNDPSDAGVGGYFRSASGSGYGVRGEATATGATTNYGGYFSAAGDTSSAVYGAATSTGTAINYGGYFTTASGSVTEPNAAKAVYGYATKTGSFVTYGGYFKSDATFGIGAYGTGRTAVKGVSSESGDSLSGYGGYFTTESGAGSAVWAQANSSGVTNTHYGGYFRAPNGNGVGIYGSGAMESARFETSEVVISDGSDAIGYATGAGDLYVGDALEVDGISYLDDVNSSSQFLAYASDTVSAPGYSWGGDTNTGLFHSAADTLNFTTAGTERMEISSTGLVGINTAPTTGYTLHVETSSATSTYGAIRGESTSASYGVYGISVSGNALQGISSTGRGVRGEATSTTAVTNYGGSFLASGTTGIGVFGEASAGSYGGYFQNTSGPAAGFNRQTDDGVVVNIRQAGTTEGTITVSGTTVSYTAFTGSHYAWPSQEIDRGYLVSFNNDNKYLNGNEKSEVIYGVDITTKANSKDVLGSYLSIQTPKEKLSVENPALVMAVGNGDMWVADNGSNLEVGDYLISSDVPGHAMKVTDEYPVAYVVARVAENVDWSKVEEKTEDGIKHKKISVLFESFILNQDLGLAFDKNQNLDDLSWFYAMEAKTPVEKAIQNQKQQLDALETKVEMIEKDGCSNNEAMLMETIEKLEARIDALEGQSVEPVKTSFWSKLW